MGEVAPENSPMYSAQIFHELGKLSSSCDAIIREMSATRLELGVRTADIIKQLGEHVKEDDLRFAATDLRMKPLEEMRSKIFGVIAATSVVWIVITTILLLWITNKGV